jgi:hypothetical protein
MILGLSFIYGCRLNANNSWTWDFKIFVQPDEHTPFEERAVSHETQVCVFACPLYARFLADHAKHDLQMTVGLATRDQFSAARALVS